MSQAVKEVRQIAFPSSEAKEVRRLREIASRKPAFKIFLNKVAVPDLALVAIPTTNTSKRLEFNIQNIGSEPAKDVFVCITYPVTMTNVVAERWMTLPPPDGYAHDHIVPAGQFGHIGFAGNIVVDVGNGFSLPPLVIKDSQPIRIPLSLMVSAPRAEKTIIRLYIEFVPGAGDIQVRLVK